MEIQPIQGQKSPDDQRAQLIKQYMFKASKLSQFKKLQKQIDAIQYQQTQTYVYLQENLQCLYNNRKLAEFFCCDKRCKQFPIICGEESCLCRPSHTKCSIILAEPFLTRISNKISQPLSKHLLQYFDAKFYIYEFMMNRISEQSQTFQQWRNHIKRVKLRQGLYLYGFDQLNRTQCFQPKVCFGDRQSAIHKKCGCVSIDFQQEFIRANFKIIHDEKQRIAKLQKAISNIKAIYSKIVDKFDQKLQNLQRFRQCVNLNVAQFQIVKFLKRNKNIDQIYNSKQQTTIINEEMFEKISQVSKNNVYGSTFLRAKQFQRGILNSQHITKYLTLEKIKQRWRRSLKFQFSRFIEGSACYQPEALSQERQYLFQTHRNSVQKLLDRIDWLEQDASENQYKIMQQPLDLDMLKFMGRKYQQIRAAVGIFEALNMNFSFVCWQDHDDQFQEIYEKDSKSKQRMLELRKMRRNQVKLDTYNAELIIKKVKVIQIIFSKFFIDLLSSDDRKKLVNAICDNFPYLQALKQSSMSIQDQQLRKKISFIFDQTNSTLSEQFSKQLSNLPNFKSYYITRVNKGQQQMTCQKVQKNEIKQENSGMVNQSQENKQEKMIIQQKVLKKQQNQTVQGANTENMPLQQQEQHVRPVKRRPRNRKKLNREIGKQTHNVVIKEDLVTVQKIRNLKRIVIRQEMLSDQLIKVLQKKTEIQQITMVSVTNGQRLIKLLQNKTKVKILNLQNAKDMPEKTLQMMQKLCPMIKHLSICQNSTITGTSIGEMSKLKFLRVSQIQGITSEQAAKGISTLTSLQHLDIMGNHWANDLFMYAVGCSLKHLSFLNCQYTQITNNGIFQLFRIPQLKTLLCGYTKLSGQGIQELSKYCTKLQTLSVRGLNGQQNMGLVKQQEIFRISHNIRLTHLDIRDCFGIKMLLLKLHRLKTLCVSHSLLQGVQVQLFEEKGIKIFQL